MLDFDFHGAGRPAVDSLGLEMHHIRPPSSRAAALDVRPVILVEIDLVIPASDIPSYLPAAAGPETAQSRAIAASGIDLLEQDLHAAIRCLESDTRAIDGDGSLGLGDGDGCDRKGGNKEEGKHDQREDQDRTAFMMTQKSMTS